MKIKNYQLQYDNQKVYPKIQASQVYVPMADMTLEEFCAQGGLTLQAMLYHCFPVGFVYKTTSYFNLLDIPDMDWEWQKIEAGVISVGEGSFTDQNEITKTFSTTDTSNNPIGEWRHILSIEEMPSHRHDLGRGYSDDGDNTTDYGSAASTTIRTTCTGGSAAHNNMMASKVVQIYKRVR